MSSAQRGARRSVESLLANAQIPPLNEKSAALVDGNDEAAWDERAATIIAKAQQASLNAATSAEEDVFSPPALEPEPGEPVLIARGAVSMSESERPKPSQRRPSLKELAERVSKTPPPPSSLSAVSTPPPVSLAPGSLAPGSLAPGSLAPGSLAPTAPGSLGAPNSLRAMATAALSTPLPTAGSGPASVGPMSGPTISVAPASLGPDSLMPGSVAPNSLAPGSVGPASVAPNSVAQASVAGPGLAKTAPKTEEKSGGYGGVIVALVGVAAAAGLFFALRSTPTDKTVANNTKTDPTAEAATTGAPAAATAAPADKPENAPKDDALDISQLGDTPAETPEDPAAPVGGPLPAGTAAVAQNEPESVDKKVEKIDPNGTLDDEMKRAAGVDGTIPKEATPAGEVDTGPKNVPDQPPQGSVTAAVGSVMGGAKACVAGADDVSRAVITFGSAGTVKSVSVSGWASGKPAASCIQGALKGANVGPFSKPTYTFGVTIRP